MEKKIRELQSKVNRLQRKNAELFMMADAIQSFATAKSADQIIDRLLEFCSQLTGARKVFSLSNKESSKKLEEGIYGAINPEVYNFILQQTKNLGITVCFNQSDSKELPCAMSNCTAIPLRGDLERFVVLIDLPLPENSAEYVEIVSKITDPFVLALKEKENAEQLIKSENALREIEQRLATTLASIGDAVIATDLDGKISFMNPVAEVLTGWTLLDASQKHILDVFKIINENSRKPVESLVTKVLNKGLIVCLANHTVLMRKNGTEVAIDGSGAPIKDKDNKITGVVLIFRDITERKKLEQQIEEYSKNLEALVEERTKQLKDSERLAAIGATAGMVGHDIRNPLQAITGDIYLAKTELVAIPESDEKNNIQESLQEIEKNVDYINKIVADLQDFARPLNPHADETDLKRVIDDLLAKNGLPENVKVSVKVETGKVVADSTFISRIMFNLVNNAVQAMPKGGKLTIHAYKEANDVLITVKDTGVGIPETVKGKLFTPMFTTKSKGQGFGLAVIKRMTEALGGTVTFESEVGKGTTFKVRLPPNQLSNRTFF